MEKIVDLLPGNDLKTSCEHQTNKVCNYGHHKRFEFSSNSVTIRLDPRMIRTSSSYIRDPTSRLKPSKVHCGRYTARGTASAQQPRRHSDQHSPPRRFLVPEESLNRLMRDIAFYFVTITVIIITITKRQILLPL